MEHSEARNATSSGRISSSRRPPAPAVTRAARLLDELAAASGPLTLATLAVSLEVPKSSVHGICAALTDSGLVTRDESGSYDLGVRVLDLAHAYLARTNLTAEFHKVLKVEAPMPEESIVLSVLDGDEIVYVAARNGSRPFGFHFSIGMRLPATCTASGKAQLGTLAESRVTELIANTALPKLTPRSVTDPDVLLAQLQSARSSGYATDDEETREGMVCVGSPILAAGSNQAVAAVGMSVPKQSFDALREAEVSQTVVHIAETLTRRLGGSSM